MTLPPQPTHQDDLERMLRILADAPAGGLSIEEIQAVTRATGETWSLRTINDLLCDLRSHVKHEKVRVRHARVTQYSLRGSTDAAH